MIDAHTGQVLPDEGLIHAMATERCEQAWRDWLEEEADPLLEPIATASYAAVEDALDAQALPPSELRAIRAKIREFREPELYDEPQLASYELDALLRRLRAKRRREMILTGGEPDRIPATIFEAKGVYLARFVTGNGSDPDLVNLIAFDNLDGRTTDVPGVARKLRIRAVEGAAGEMWRYHTALLFRADDPTSLRLGEPPTPARRRPAPPPEHRNLTTDLDVLRARSKELLGGRQLTDGSLIDGQCPRCGTTEQLRVCANELVLCYSCYFAAG